jgi:ubiquinone/menaquinone biosynthesis C-methylase UbiE
MEQQQANSQDQTTKVGGGNELLDVNFILQDNLNIQPGNIVADLGAGGAAYFTMHAAKLVGDQGEVYAVDIIKAVLSGIESKAQMSGVYNIKTIWSNLEILGATKIPAETIDHALLINILFQSKKRAEVIAEATRLLKSGGKLTVIDWHDTKPTFAPPAERQVDPAEIIKIAEKLSLSLEKEFPAGNYHFGLIFIK